MKTRIKGFYYSFPIQLLFLHTRKYQTLLLFWVLLFSTVSGGFMKTFGADALFLSPEYLGNVNSLSFAITGMAFGVFIMSWNITTFILFSRHFRFLAATTNPFLKYCINNTVIPVVFLIFYFIKSFRFNYYKELTGVTEISFFIGGFIIGLIIILSFSLLYFFRADRSIHRRLKPIIANPSAYITHLQSVKEVYSGKPLINVHWYFESPGQIRRARNVSHYTNDFIKSVFKRHHFAAVLSIFAAFLFLFFSGFFLDHAFFQLPAAASIIILFAVLIGVAGAITYFLQSWSIPFLIGLVLIMNIFYKINWIDPRNKAYGLNYTNKTERPSYTREGLMALCKAENTEADRQNMLEILNAWKKKQDSDRPLLVLINTSGGGHRSATFTMSVMQYLDSITNGNIMKKMFMITGASGGMIGAAYFRELYFHKQQGDNIRLQDKKYVDNIAEDLLNPLFSSFFARDIFSPSQKFRIGKYSYVKDRGYAFEQKLNVNTNGFLNKRLADYKEDEKSANIPLLFFNSVVTRDGRKMLISTQPVRFMMQPYQKDKYIPSPDPDVVDFASFFAKQDPLNMRMLTALRMNATFPVVLPNVWLPSEPVIDVMDAGLRDNYGQETSLRFLSSFEDWIRQNTSGVLIIQIRDRKAGGWEAPFLSSGISDYTTKPFLVLQHNWFKMMEYSQNDMLNYYAGNNSSPLYKIIFQYGSGSEEKKAALNFHITRQEEKSVMASIYSPDNQQSFKQLSLLLDTKKLPVAPKAE